MFALSLAVGSAEALDNNTPLWQYLANFFSIVYASTCQHVALLRRRLQCLDL